MREAYKRVIGREEFTQELMERVDDVTKIGPVVQFVDSVLRLQNDMSRPVYVLELAGEPTEDLLQYIDDIMNQAKVACVLVPPKTLEYVAEVDEDSFGSRNIRAEMFGLKDGVKIPVVPEEKEDEDGRRVQGDGNAAGGVQGAERGGDAEGGLPEGEREAQGR